MVIYTNYSKLGATIGIKTMVYRRFRPVVVGGGVRKRVYRQQETRY